MTTIQLGRPTRSAAQSSPQPSANHRTSTPRRAHPTRASDAAPRAPAYLAVDHRHRLPCRRQRGERHAPVRNAPGVANVRRARPRQHSPAELTRAAPVGRHAGTAAALISAAFANIAIATGVGAALAALGLSIVGAVAFAASLVAVGAVFAGVAAVMAQVATNPRSALGLGSALVAISFVLRAVPARYWVDHRCLSRDIDPDDVARCDRVRRVVDLAPTHRGGCASRRLDPLRALASHDVGDEPPHCRRRGNDGPVGNHRRVDRCRTCDDDQRSQLRDRMIDRLIGEHDVSAELARSADNL
jgi:hypothetical protein